MTQNIHTEYIFIFNLKKYCKLIHVFHEYTHTQTHTHTSIDSKHNI